MEAQNWEKGSEQPPVNSAVQESIQKSTTSANSPIWRIREEEKHHDGKDEWQQCVEKPSWYVVPVITKFTQGNMTNLSEQTAREPCAWKRASTVRRGAIGNAPVTGNALVAYSTYEIRQHFIFCGKRLNSNQLDKIMQKHEAYRLLPSKVSQQVLRLLDKNMQSYFAALDAWKKDPSKFLGRPRLPGYKDKREGRNILVYTIQAISKKSLREGIIKPSQLGIEIRTRQRNIDQVRMVPKKSGCYVVEVVYTQEEEQEQLDHSLVAAVDIGVNNLVALTSNKRGFVPRLVNGRPIKSVNQCYNKHIRKLQKRMSSNHHTSREGSGHLKADEVK